MINDECLENTRFWH